jgi:hypothetical protein
MARVMTDFVVVLNECNAIQETKTANLLIDLAKGNIATEHLLEGDIPMFINKSITEIGKISYATKNRIEYNSWTDTQASDLENRQRVKAKVGRALGKIFYASFLESHFDGKMANDVEVFTSQLKSKFMDVDDDNFNLSAPFSHYHYDYTCGTLGDSCMRHDECVSDGYFDLYDHEDTPVQLVTYDDGDGIQSRALLWSLPEGKYLDRIYETHDGDMDVFKDLAVRKGWIYKQRQSYSNKIGWVKDRANIDIPLIVPVAHWDECSNFPYIDTFTYGFKHNGDCYLTNDRKHAWSKLGVKKFRAYECTGGGWANQNITEVYRVCPKEFTTSKDVSFGESTYTLYEGNTRYSNVLNPTGDDYWEFAQYDEKSGNVSIIRWRDKHGGSQYFHISECKRCDYSSNTYPNHPEVDVEMKRIKWGNNREGFVNMEYFIKDFKGVWQPKSECAVFLDKYDVAKVINTNCGGRVVKDIVGVNRLQSECVRIGGRVDAYIHKKEVFLIKMLSKRTEESLELRKIVDQVRCELNI